MTEIHILGYHLHPHHDGSTKVPVVFSTSRKRYPAPLLPRAVFRDISPVLSRLPDMQLRIISVKPILPIKELIFDKGAGDRVRAVQTSRII